MATWRPDWEGVVDAAATAGKDRLTQGATPLPDEVIFEALTVALLSGNTRWDRIARVRGALRDPFADFDLPRFASVSDEEIERNILPWFRERKAGAPGLRASLVRLRAAAAKLARHQGGAHRYLLDTRASTTGSPEDLAVALATSKAWKLPGFGIALAAEALRNLGLDLCKPDRHVLRAVGAWSLVDFARWKERGAFTPPQARAAELRETMLAVRYLAEANQLPVSYANSVIWTAGAVSGARLTNAALRALTVGCGTGEARSQTV
uniref:hypothetical protein n=1 Tax=Sphingomonas bacterium TaxID=1895847 RepID=UPI0026076D89|nr:hypothetical protein [Sphingomonas bacterium]